MREEQLRRAIERPAGPAGLILEPGLVSTILRDVSGEPGMLPLLSHALLETWKRRSGTLVTLIGYLQSGGVRGAIAQTAETTYHARLTPQQQQLARTIFVRLTALGHGTEDTRRRVNRRELQLNERQRPEVDRILSILIDARLVIADHDTVEVAHEALIREWPRLHEWLDEDREGLRILRHLTEAAQDWEAAGHDPGLLYRGPRLTAAMEWARRRADELNDLEHTFVDSSSAAEINDLAVSRRRNRRLRALVLGLGVLLIVAAGLVVYASNQSSRAERERNIALSRAIAGQAQLLLPQHPDSALLVALEAYKRNQTSEARSILLAAVQRTRAVERLLSGQHDEVSSIAVSRNGLTVATGDANGKLVLWRGNGLQPHELSRLHGAITAIEISSRGLVAVATHDIAAGEAQIRVLDARTGQSVAVLRPSDGGEVDRLSFTRDGRVLTSLDAFDGRVRRWNMQSQRELPAAAQLRAAVRGPSALARDADRAMVMAPGRQLLVIETQTGHVIARLNGSGIPSAAALSDDGQLAAVARARGRVQVVTIATGRSVATIARRTKYITALAFTSDGRMLAVGYEDSLVSVVNASTGTPASTMPGLGNTAVQGIAFTARGHQIVTVSDNGTPIIRNRGGSTRLEHTIAVPRDAVAIEVSHDGATLAIARANGNITLQPIRGSSRPTVSLRGPSRSGAMAFSPDDRSIAAVDGDRSLYVWSTSRPGEAPRVLHGYASGLTSVAFNRNGDQVIVSGDQTLTLWDLRTRHPRPRLIPTGSGREWSVAWLPTEGHVVSAGTDRARVWNTHTMRPVGRPLAGTKGEVVALDVSPNGETLATGGPGRSARLWDVRSHQPLGIPINTGSVDQLAFTPRGREIVLGDRSGLWFWQTSPQRQLGGKVSMPAPRNEGGPGSYNPTRLAMRDTDLLVLGRAGVVALSDLLWSSSLQRLRERVCRLVGRGLTRSEWQRYVPGVTFRPACAGSD